MNIDDIKEKIELFENNTIALKGKVNTLEEQFTESTDKLEELKDLAIINSKAVELLNCVQKATRDLIKETFENVVTNALNYIHQSNDYKFELEFDRRGNIPKLRFLIKTPDMKESHELIHTRAGGAKDVVVLALRCVLLEISRNKSFLFGDELFKRLDNEETTMKTIEFIKEVQKNTNRQIFLITHRSEIVNSVDKPIIIKENK